MRFFVQIFLSFWIISIAIFIVVTRVFPDREKGSPENLALNLEMLLDRSIMRTFALAQSGNCAALPPGDPLVIDEQDTDVCGRPVPPGALALVTRVRGIGQRASLALGGSFAFAGPVSVSGRRLIGVSRTPLQQPPWIPHLSFVALAVSALVTFIVAFLLTKPVRALRDAFRQFAAGDMTVRLPAGRRRWLDWGGADVRTLMGDFNEMAGKLQALVEAHKVLLRDVSHELRSPLARLNLALELARDESSAPVHALERAEMESGKLNQLIGELLSLSAMEMSEGKLPLGSVSLADIVDDLMSDLTFEAEARGCGIVHTIEGTTAVRGNADVLRRAIDNVVRNAIRYTPVGGVVHVTSGETGNDGVAFASVTVCDRGPGVPEEQLKDIFRPFYRVDPSRQSSTGGFGIGLAIADRAMHVHRGNIRAFNRAGGGLCVALTIPAASGA